jgi:Gpi18-like mannosyltransferase
MAEAEAGAVRVPGRETPQVDRPLSFSVRVPAILVALLAGLIVRLILAAYPGFGVDMGTFQAWSFQLADTGPWNFYDTDFFTDYAPGYLYVLWFIGELHEMFTFTGGQYEYILKLPSIAADLASAYLLYRLLDDQRQEVRTAAALAYLLFPATLFVGSVWGQVDSLLAFFLLLSVYFIGRNRPVAGAVAYTVAFLVKPQAIAALPFLVFWVLRNYPPRVWAEAAGAGVLTGLLLIFPFFQFRPWELYDQLRFSADVYPFASFHAYNFWSTFAYLERDNIEYLGLSYQVWGFVLFAVSMAFVLYAFRRSEGMGALALGTALSVLLFYMFVTRMHERYLFPVFLLLLAACVIYNNRWLWAGFVGLSVINSLNLYHAYAEFNDNYVRVDWVFDWLQDPNFWGFGLTTVEFLSLFMVAMLPPVLALAYALAEGPKRPEAT